jgi:hypothetical protein
MCALPILAAIPLLVRLMNVEPVGKAPQVPDLSVS